MRSGTAGLIPLELTSCLTSLFAYKGFCFAILSAVAVLLSCFRMGTFLVAGPSALREMFGVAYLSL